MKYYSAFNNINDSQYRKEKFRLQIELLKLQEWVLKHNKRVAIIFKVETLRAKAQLLNVLLKI